jgi:SAM-dependent methyltransferase
MTTAGAATHADVERAYAAAIQSFNDSELCAEIRSPAHYEYITHLQILTVLDGLPDGGRVLDIGTGPGLVPHALHLLGYDVVSIDHPRDPSSALRRIKDLGVDGYSAEVGVDPLPLPADSVDAVFAGDVIEHLPNSPKAFVSALVGVLRPGGKLVLSTPNATRLLARVKMMMGYSNWPPLEDFYDDDLHMGHHKEYTADELRSVLMDAGLVDVRIAFVESRIGEIAFSSLADIRTQNRCGKDVQEARGPAAAAIRAARELATMIVKLRPSLASVMLGSGRKA